MGKRGLNDHMLNMLPENEALAPAVETIKSIISLFATCVGLVVIVIGLKYATDILQIIFTILQSPSYLTDPIRQMADVIGGSAFDQRWESRSVFVANMLSLTVYFCGILLCAWLTLAIMNTGAKIVSLTAGDRDAVKKLLQTAFGKRLQPKAAAVKNENKTRDISRPQS